MMSRAWTDVKHIQVTGLWWEPQLLKHLSGSEFKYFLQYAGRKLALPKQRELHWQESPTSDSGTVNLIIRVVKSHQFL